MIASNAVGWTVKRGTHHIWRSLFGLTLACVDAGLLPSVSAPFPHEPVIRSTTQLVQVTVVASGPRGATAIDLKREDFRVAEQGVYRPISVFVRNWVANEMPARFTVRSFGRFSNSSPQQTLDSHNILLLDQLETSWQDWERAWPEVVHFIEQLGPGDHIAIYSLDLFNGLQILQDFGDDPRTLLSRIEKLKHPTLASLLPVTPAPEEAGEPSFATRDDSKQMPELLSFGRLRGLINALHAIADHLGGFRGEKR